ncbi:MAG: hypothetical protein ABSF83_02470 [Nitrososphaerales archaeon]|jgi:GMP synthase-like glutamine amidotransferase
MATKLLVLNNRGLSVDSLVAALRGAGATVDLVEPEAFVGAIPAGLYDGVVASGGYLRAASRAATLGRYSELFRDLDRPYLGVCLGMKVLGFCYGARIGNVGPVVGTRRVSLDGFPLCPGLSEFAVHQNHRYELLRPLPPSLRDYTSSGPTQAVKVADRDLYAVQFHPEVGSSPARVIMENFVSLCAGRPQRH